MSRSKKDLMHTNSAIASTDQEQTTQGSSGSIITDPSLAAERLIVSGKGALPELALRRLRRRRVIETEFEFDRIPIIGSERDPWRMICSLEILSPITRAFGTGWFVGPSTLVTAGHCVFDKAMGGKAFQIIVYPGRYDIMDKVFPYPKDPKFTKPIVSTRFQAAPGWEDSQSPNLDYAVIQLDEAVGDETGWFSVALKADSTLQDHLINIAGYPADKNDGRVQYFDSDKIERVTEQRFFYKADTSGGQSGSPVWIQATLNSVPEVVGIHTNGEDRRSFGASGNSARRIDTEVFKNITQWIKEAKD
jgi:glutamyl endopeptidase